MVNENVPLTADVMVIPSEGDEHENTSSPFTDHRAFNANTPPVRFSAAVPLVTVAVRVNVRARINVKLRFILVVSYRFAYNPIERRPLLFVKQRLVTG